MTPTPKIFTENLKAKAKDENIVMIFMIDKKDTEETDLFAAVQGIYKALTKEISEVDETS